LRSENLQEDRRSHPEYKAAFTRPLTRADVVAIALEKNMRAALAARRAAIMDQKVTEQWLGLLPRFEVDVSSDWHGEHVAKTSTNVQSGVAGAEFTYGRPQGLQTYKVAGIWNLIDFGMAVHRARQAEGNRAAYLHEVDRVRQNVALDATEAYWQALSARRIADLAADLVTRVEEVDRSLQRRMEEGALSRRVGLRQRAQLLRFLKRLRGHRQGYRIARARLAEVMGVGGAPRLELAPMPLYKGPGRGDIDVQDLEKEALLSRPELHQLDVQEWVKEEEVRATVTDMFPSPDLILRHTREDNPMLLYESWMTLGAQVATDLLRLPQKWHNLQVQKMREELLRHERTVLAVGIMTQVNLSVVEYRAARARAQASGEVTRTQNQLMGVLEAMAAEGNISESEALVEEVNTFFTRMRELQSYADLRIAQARLENSVGRAPAGDVDVLPLTTVAVGSSGGRAPLWKTDRVEEVEAYTPPPEVYGIRGAFYAGLPPAVPRILGPESAPGASSVAPVEGVASAQTPEAETN
jgi:outer membrane protein TolC